MENLNLMVGSEKFVFEKSVDMDWLIENIGEGLKSWEEKFVGDGIYKFVMGSRGWVEDVVKVSDGNVLNYMSKEELIEMVMEEYEGNFEDEEELMDYLDEFVCSEVIDGLYVSLSLNEEEGVDYYWVRG